MRSELFIFIHKMKLKLNNSWCYAFFLLFYRAHYMEIKFLYFLFAFYMIEFFFLRIRTYHCIYFLDNTYHFVNII